jgi:hypothetical protein
LITKFGWHLLTVPLQDEANAVADEVIAAWEQRNSRTAWEQWVEGEHVA